MQKQSRTMKTSGFEFAYTVEAPIKDAPNKGHLRIKDTIQSTKKLLSYSAI